MVDRESDTSDPDMPDDEDEDMEEDIEREETPDLYRNSSLGMCVSVRPAPYLFTE